MEHKPKLIVILGPTSSGKTDMAIELAKKFDGEIVSADSRQVYKGMDIGSGKATPAQQAQVPHHLLDVADPKDRFTVADYKELADTAIADITSRGKTPFLVGGTGLYISAVVDNFQIPRGDEDMNYRAELEKKSLVDLLAQLKTEEPASYARVDLKNKRRVTRALEVAHISEKPFQQEKCDSVYDVLLVGIEVPREELYKRIDQRVNDRIAEGMVEEVQRLLKEGVTEKQMYDFGQEYRSCLQFIQGEWKTKEEMAQRLKYAIHGFARRQGTWFRKDKRIVWIKDQKEAEEVIYKWL
ncbi:MAG: tRNA (adenosine(37)-N6)-dimethylallyltransferase MiaA [bacterium]|nr:tRNA (adenosine(37)-N6)-dimethylallyltransferase MiaA [bacterium]